MKVMDQPSSMAHTVCEKAGMFPQISQLDTMKQSHDNLHGVLALRVLVLRGGLFSSLVETDVECISNCVKCNVDRKLSPRGYNISFCVGGIVYMPLLPVEMRSNM